MRLVKTSLVVLLSTWQTLSWAGSSTHGGHVVVCDDSTYKLLDHFEAVQNGLDLDLGGDDLSVAEKVQYVLDRLSILDESRGREYSDQASEFFNNAIFRDEIPETTDMGEVNLPDNCALRQLAVQLPPRFPGDIVFAIERDLWDDISADDQAGLVLHEILFTESISREILVSQYIRRFNGAISSADFANRSPEQYATLLSETGFSLPDVVFRDDAFISPFSEDENYYYMVREPGDDRIEEHWRFPKGSELSGGEIIFSKYRSEPFISARLHPLHFFVPFLDNYLVGGVYSNQVISTQPGNDPRLLFSLLGRERQEFIGERNSRGVVLGPFYYWIGGDWLVRGSEGITKKLFPLSSADSYLATDGSFLYAILAGLGPRRLIQIDPREEYYTTIAEIERYSNPITETRPLIYEDGFLYWASIDEENNAYTLNRFEVETRQYQRLGSLPDLRIISIFPHGNMLYLTTSSDMPWFERSEKKGLSLMRIPRNGGDIEQVVDVDLMPCFGATGIVFEGSSALVTSSACGRIHKINL